VKAVREEEMELWGIGFVKGMCWSNDVPYLSSRGVKSAVD